MHNGKNYNSIHALNRAQLLDDSFNLARYDYLDFSIALDLLKYLRHETDLIPLIAGFKSIEFLIESLNAQTYFEDLYEILLNIVDDIYVRINNSSHPENKDYHVLTKLHVNLFACKIGAKSCLEDATTKLNLTSEEADINERPYLYCGALKNDLSSTIWNQLKMKVLKSNDNEQFYRDNEEEFNEIFEAFSSENLFFIFKNSNNSKDFSQFVTMTMIVSS